MFIFETRFFNDRFIIYYLGLRSYVLNHLHERCIYGPVEKVFHEITVWIGNRAFRAFIVHKTLILHLYHHGDVFYNSYIETED